MPWLGWCLSCNQKTAPACHLGSQVLVVSNYLSKLNMLEVSAGTVWQLKYTGYIFGHGTITFGNFIPKSLLGGESLKKSTAYPMALWASLPSLAKLVHQGREEVETVWDTWPCLMCHATAGLCSLTDSEGSTGLSGPMLSSKALPAAASARRAMEAAMGLL